MKPILGILPSRETSFPSLPSILYINVEPTVIIPALPYQEKWEPNHCLSTRQEKSIENIY
jgi:hypothetical protein